MAFYAQLPPFQLYLSGCLQMLSVWTPSKFCSLLQIHEKTTFYTIPRIVRVNGNFNYIYIQTVCWITFVTHILTHSNTMTPFDAPGKQAF